MPQDVRKPRYSSAQVERIRHSLEAGEAPAAIAQREGRSYSAVITLKHRLGVETVTRDSIGSLQGQRDRLVGEVATLGARKQELETAVRELEERHGALAAIVKGLEQRKVELEQGVYQLEQVKAPQLIQGLRRQLMEAGWVPVGEMNPTLLGLAAVLKWASARRG